MKRAWMIFIIIMLAVPVTLLVNAQDVISQPDQKALLTERPFSWDHTGLGEYQLTDCRFMPAAGSDKTYLSCSFYQPASTNLPLIQCVHEYDYLSPDDKCIPSGIFLGLLNKDHSRFENHWLMKRETLLKHGVFEFQADAQGNLWAVNKGRPHDPSTKLYKILTNSENLFFNLVTDYHSQIYSVVVQPNDNIMVLTAEGKIYEYGLDGQQKRVEDGHARYVFQFRKFPSLYRFSPYMFVQGWPKYLAPGAYNRAFMLSEGWLGFGDKTHIKEVEFIGCRLAGGGYSGVAFAPTGKTGFVPTDKFHYVTDEDNDRIVSLSPNDAKLFRQYDIGNQNHQFVIYDLNVQSCHVSNPLALDFRANDTVRFNVYPLGNQGEFLVLSKVFHYETRTYTEHLMKVGTGNKVIWDQLLRAYQDAEYKARATPTMIIDPAGKKGLILFDRPDSRPSFYEISLD
ncbi:MAG: hypothetical protein JNK86_04380 [Alphaproteobacteria bacterium]|nr:hypothetical protein [Alphaproteobacteria bacterium]